MAAYHNRGSHAHRSRLPPTPPEYQTTYLSPMSAGSEEAHAYYSTRSQQGRNSYHSKDQNERYQAPAHSTHNSHGRSKRASAMADYSMNYPQPLPMQYQYAPAPAPMLPPIQVPDEMSYLPPYSQHQVNEVKQKEDKPTGGVAQHLDYDIDMMANFVAEMCQQMVSRVSASPTSQFRKYVSQILSSTRLPSSTIMLGLFYLQERMKFEKGDLNSSASLMRMLTTCLLLGSKFLDDNTFQNRSWAEVSSIPVQELNVMELEWLKDFNWEIHGLMYDENQGFFMWIEHWHAYAEKATMAQMTQQVKASQKLAPIDTKISRYTAAHPAMMSPDCPIPPQYQQTPAYDATWARAPRYSDYSPPSTHHSGPNTPEYYGTNWQYPAMTDNYHRAAWNAPNKSAYAAQRAQVSPYYAPSYSQGYQINTWSPHDAHCRCGSCHKQIPEYYVSHGYAVQPVIG